jgi:hypothetical protein
MKREKLYTEQASVKLSREVMEKMRELKGMGVDVGELRRLAVTKAIEEAHQGLVAS